MGSSPAGCIFGLLLPGNHLEADDIYGHLRGPVGLAQHPGIYPQRQLATGLGFLAPVAGFFQPDLGPGAQG